MICRAGLVPKVQDAAGTERYVRLLQIASSSGGPVVELDMEARYEAAPSWGSPAARVEAAEATMRTLGARPDLHTRLSGDLDRLLTDAHPAVRTHAGMHLWFMRESDPTVFRARLSDRVRTERNAAVLRFLSERVLFRTIAVDAAFAESLVLGLLAKSAVDREALLRLRMSLATNVTVLAVRHQRKGALAVIEDWISDCAVFHGELGQVVSAMREGYTVGLREGGSSREEVLLRGRCLALGLRIAEAAAADFTARVAQAEMTDAEKEMARQSAQILERMCREVHFAVIGQKGRDGSEETPEPELRRFLEEATPILMCLADAGTPSTVYTLLEVLDHLVPLDPGKVFDIAMHAALGGGRRSGFQFESMGADRLVGMVGRLLADYRWVFDVEERRQTLVLCLELFAGAGWPSASRLLYRLPGLFR